MPELPEVETIRRGLQKRIVSKKIIGIEIRVSKNFVGDKEIVLGQRVVDVVRRAKVVAIKLENNNNLLFHLKMTGQLVFRQSSVAGSQSINHKLQTADQFAGGHPDHNWHAKLPNNTTATVFTFNDESKLFFNDLRKFGWCKILSNDKLQQIFDDEYGPEPFDPKFNAEYLMLTASKIPNRKFKQFLLDQSIIAGIGNIYADEIAFDVSIMPDRKVKDISLSEWKKIVESTRKILELAISHGGTTDSDYVNADGEKGGMQDYLKVYRKTGLLCPGDCGGVIKRMSIGGRGTHFCPKCQH